jgi:homocysteine S-methyltransferase
MDLNFFKKTRILDGGMGQELLARGMEPNGTLWSANALLQEKYHNLLLDTHIDFIKSGAEVIVTTTFTTRKIRLKDNKVEDKFEYLNKKAGGIAQKAKELYPDVLVAGGLPPQYLTYEADTRSDKEIMHDFSSQAEILNPYVDFFYFDVLSSVKEFSIAIDSIKKFNKPYLLGAHISEGTSLPSGEKISENINKINHVKLLGIILSCISPENYELNLNEI